VISTLAIEGDAIPLKYADKDSVMNGMNRGH